MEGYEFAKLGRGDIIRHKMSAESVLVDGNYGSHVIAVRTYEVTNPDEWDLIHKAHYKIKE